MKLTIALAPHRLALRRPLQTGRGELTHRSGWTVTVRAADGTTGRGEASPLPGWSRVEAEAVGEALAAWRPAWAPDAPETGLPVVPEARFAAEHAMATLYAQAAGQRLPRWLAPGAADRVAVNALCSGVPDAIEAVRLGFGTLKLKVGGAVNTDLARVRAMRDAVGPAVRIRLDANQGWTRKQARDALDGLVALGIEALEEPTAGGPAAWAALVGPVPLAADESCRDEADLDAVLAAGTAGAVVIKPMLVGGLRRSLRLASRAQAAGLTVWVTTSLDGVIGRRGALAVALAQPGLAACGLATGAWLAEDLGPDLAIEGGFARWT